MQATDCAVQVTDYVALYAAAVSTYAAVVATVVAAWNVHREIWRERVRLKVRLRSRVLLGEFMHPLPIIVVEVANLSAFAVKVANAGIHVGEEANGIEDPHLDFTIAPQLAALGYSLPFTVAPRETGKSAILESSLRRYIDTTAEPRSVPVRAYVELADGSVNFGEWETLQVTRESITLKA